MTKRILAFILFILMTAAMITGCDEGSDSETTGGVPSDTSVIETTGGTASDATGTDEVTTAQHEHVIDYNEKYENADDTSHYYTCKTCGELVAEKHVSKLFYDVNGHYYSCDCRWNIGEHTAHTLENGKCTVCGYTEDPNHKHSYTEYSYDGVVGHTKICDCGKYEREDHVKDELKNSDSEHYYECPCGFKFESERHKWGDDGKCTVCGYKGHVCSYDKTTFTDTEHSFHCSECGGVSTAAHSYYDQKEYTVTATTHYKKCDYCDYKLTESHGFDNGHFIIDSCTVCNCPLPSSIDLEFELRNGSYTLVGIGSCKDIHIVVPNNIQGIPVTAVASSAFEGNKSIVYVKLPESITEIGSSAFAGCTSLKAVNLPLKLTVIKDNTFAACTSLVGVNIPDSVKTVEMFAFSGCTSLEGFRNDIKDPSVNNEPFTRLTYIGDSAFSGCKSLKGDLSFVGYEYIGILAFNGCSSVKSVELWTVTVLSGDAFSGCTSLESVAVEPEALKMNEGWGFDIGTFSSCTSLKTMTMTDTFEKWVEFFANSTVDEEMGLSWYKGTPDFTVEFTRLNKEGEWEKDKTMKISEIYKYLDENYWE